MYDRLRYFHYLRSWTSISTFVCAFSTANEQAVFNVQGIHTDSLLKTPPPPLPVLGLSSGEKWTNKTDRYMS